MPTINFQSQFAGLVAHGHKQQTIRKTRKRPFKLGDRIQLYTGLRTKKCEKLAEANISELIDIRITDSTITLAGIDYPVPGTSQPCHEVLDDLVIRDGFTSIHHLMQWFEKTYGLPFEGHVIRWKYEDEEPF